MRMNRGIKILIVVACVTVAFFLGLSRFSANRDGRKLQEVQAVAWKLPVFSGFREVESSTTSGSVSAMVTRRFKCISDCDGAVEYYSQTLGASGWSRDSSMRSRNETLFRKGDLTISVFRSEASNVYDYALDVTWRSR